VKPEMLYS